MSLNMMNSHKRKLSCKAYRLCLRHTYKKCTYKSRTIGYRNRIYIIKRNLSLTKCLFYNLINLFYMLDESLRKERVENILNFEDEYSAAVTVRLEQNYRSTENILNAANAVIKNNKYQKENDKKNNAHPHL